MAAKQTTNKTLRQLRAEDNKRRKVLIDEALGILLKRANVTKKDILEAALPRWANAHQDLFTAAERKKYQNIIA